MSFSGAGQGALTGAGTGAQIGSMFGMPGAGALAGGVLGGLSGAFGQAEGKPGEFKKVETLSPEQQKLLNQLIQMLDPEGKLGLAQGQGLDYLLELLDPSSAAQQRFADPYIEQFEQQTVPGLAERFAGAGAQGGALSSSGFGQALSTAGAGLQSQLAQLKSQLQSGAAKDIMQQFQQTSGQALGAQPFGYQYTPPSGGYATGIF